MGNELLLYRCPSTQGKGSLNLSNSVQCLASELFFHGFEDTIDIDVKGALLRFLRISLLAQLNLPLFIFISKRHFFAERIQLVKSIKAGMEG